jgi:biopolymer transport protein ExbD
MRYFFIAILFFAAGCSGRQTAQQPSQIDTVRLFDPFPEPPSAQDVLMFKNSIALFHGNYTIINFGKENFFNELKEVSAYFEKNAVSIKQQKFYIVIDSNTKFEKTVAVIDALKKYRIDNYRVINYQEYFNPPSEPVTIETPKTVTTRVVDEDDSTYLSITIFENRIETKIRDKSANLKNVREVNDFVEKNKLLIDSNKIILSAPANMPSEKFKSIIEVFKKYGYYKFQMITREVIND